MHRSRSHDAVIRVYDAAGNVIETHQESVSFLCQRLRLTSRIVRTVTVVNVLSLKTDLNQQRLSSLFTDRRLAAALD